MVGCSPLSGPDDPDAAQTQRRSPPPHPEDDVQGAELAGLRSRPAPAGSLTVWIEEAALEWGQTTGPNGQARYADAAIQTSLRLVPLSNVQDGATLTSTRRLRLANADSGSA